LLSRVTNCQSPRIEPRPRKLNSRVEVLAPNHTVVKIQTGAGPGPWDVSWIPLKEGLNARQTHGQRPPHALHREGTVHQEPGCIESEVSHMQSLKKHGDPRRAAIPL
jgi:hypothetical protein